MLETNRLRPVRQFSTWQLVVGGAILVLSIGAAVLVSHRSSLPAAYRYPFSESLTARERSRTGAFSREIAFYQARVEQNPADGLDLVALAGAYLSKARVTGENAWYTLAESAATRSLARLPVYNAGARLVLAEVASAHHDFPKSLEVIESLLKSEPRNASAISLRTSVELARGDLGLARRDADRLVLAMPNPANLTLRATTLEGLGDAAAARRDFERALRLEDADDVFTSARVRALFGRYWVRLGKTDLARGLLLESLRIAPNYPLAALYLANLELDAGHLGRAEELFTSLRGVQGSPSTYDHAALLGLARIRTRQGSPEAVALWTQAITTLRLEVAHGAFGHRRELARALLERGQVADVEEAYTNAKLEAELRHDAETLEVLRLARQRCGDVASCRL